MRARWRSVRDASSSWSGMSRPTLSSFQAGLAESRVFITLWVRADTRRRTQPQLTAEPVAANERGQKYAIRAILKGPAGEAMVVSVWFLPRGSDVPRFVTAYPWSER